MSGSRTARPLGLDDLLQLARRPRRWGCPILDIRPPALARRGHLRGSAWLPVSDPTRLDEELPTHLLPSRGSRIAVASDEPLGARFVAEHLCRKGFGAVWLEVGLAGVPFDPGPPQGALWTPDPYLMEHVAQLPEPRVGPVADLGAGNGRSAVFLAARGHEVHCFERLPDALELCEDRARRSGVTIHPHQQLLMENSRLEGGPFATILMLRYLDKGLLARADEHLLSGGAVVVHTYSASPHRGDPPGQGPLKERHLLKPEELADLLPDSKWEFLHRSPVFDQPGKTMIGFVAQRRS